MNREIKFRAWDKKTKTIGWVVSYAGDMCTILWEGDRQECGIDTKNIEVMQYTGLKDKNGKEIYEGDIVEFKGFSIEEIKFEEGCFNLEWHNKNYKVIGNIYENNKLI